MTRFARAFLALVVLTAGTAYAQTAKTSVQVADFTLVPGVTSSTEGDPTYESSWTDILSADIHTSSQKDLVMNVSLEAGLFTDTKVVSKNLTRDESKALARIQVRVVVDDDTNLAHPGVVVFAEREQGLIAKFSGYFECTDTDGDGYMEYGECTYTDPEELELWLNTLNANAFSFVLDDVGTGWHDVKVQARIYQATAAQEGSASAKAWIGKGAITVEEVRLVKGQDVVLDQF